MTAAVSSMDLKTKDTAGRGIGLKFVLAVFLLNKAFVLIPSYIAIRRQLEGMGLIRAALYLVSGNFSKWDSTWYLNIAKSGYYSRASAAFFPLYPLLSRALGAVSGLGTLYAGLVLSNLAFISILYLARKLALLDYDEIGADRIVLLLGLFPTSFFFSAFYTESLFMAASLLSLYAMRTGRWPLAGISGLFAAATRNTGIFLVIPFFIEYMINTTNIGPGNLIKPRSLAEALDLKHPTKHRKLLWIAAIPLSTGLYMLYLWKRFGDPLAFKDSEAYFHRYTMDPALSILRGAYETISGTIRHTYAHSTDNYFLYLLFFVLAALVVLVSSIGRVRLSYWAVMLYSVMIPLSTPYIGKPDDYFTSFSRYMLVIFPIFIGIYEMLKRKRTAYFLTLSVSAGFLAILVYSWSLGIFIA